MLGLAVGVGLVIAISSLSNGLDEAQAATLDPLAGIGTDLTVTRTAQQDTGGGPFGGGGGRDVVEANQAVITDLSKLGKAGTHFVHDFFLPGTQLTFTQAQANEIAALDGVAAVSAGLTLQAVHQEGKVPKIVAKIQTGGDKIEVNRAITPPTAAEQAKIAACMEKLGITPNQGPSTDSQPGGGLGGQGGARAANPGAFAKCLPARMQRFRETITTPRETLAAGARPAADRHQERVVHDRRRPARRSDHGSRDRCSGERRPLPEGRPRGARLGHLRRPEVAEGRVEARPERDEVHGRRAREPAARRPGRRRLPAARAAPEALGPEEPRERRARTRRRQRLRRRPSRRASRRRTRRPRSRARRTSPARSAARSSTPRTSLTAWASRSRSSPPSGRSCSPRCSPSPRSASECASSGRSRRSGGRSARSCGRLRASPSPQGVLGGVAGCRARYRRRRPVGVFGPTLTASSTTGAGSLFGVEQAARTTSEAVSLSAPVGIPILLAGFALAVVGGLLAGAAGAFRAARLRPADALRTVE